MLLVEKSRLNRITSLALPIIGGMLSQNILNLVDTAMVGTLGNSALAAVGLGGFAAFMCQALVIGISSGVQATASRRKGEGLINQLACSLNSGLVLSLLMGTILTLVLYWLVPHFYPYLNNDAEVIKLGVPYLQIRVLVIVAVGINFAFRGYWNAVDQSKMYMSTLIVMHISNIIFNYIFIFGKFGAPQMGVNGAALGTSLSTVLGSIMYFLLGIKYARENGFLKFIPSKDQLKSLFKLSLPDGIQQLFFSAGFTTLYWIIGKVGTDELAAANVLINIILVAILPSLGLGISAATLVGQALGKEDIADARQWGWDVMKVGIIGIGLLGLPMVFFPSQILQIFIHDPSTIMLAKLPVQISGLTLFIDSIGLILMKSLLGAGDAKRVMKISIFLQWIMFLPLAYLIGPVLGYGLIAIWIFQVLYRSIQAIVFGYIWRGPSWTTIKV